MKMWTHSPECRKCSLEDAIGAVGAVSGADVRRDCDKDSRVSIPRYMPYLSRAGKNVGFSFSDNEIRKTDLFINTCA